MNEKTQQFFNVLQILESHGLSKELILVGGWCLEIYRNHFNDSSFPVVQTQDIDILIRNPFPPIRKNIDQIFIEHGFLKDFSPGGHTHYVNESLEIEFLTPTKGKGTDKPVEVKRLNVTAQALQFMNIIQKHVQLFSFHDIPISAPNPCVFALIKLLVSNRRNGAFRIKAEKDRETALGILEYLSQNHPEELNDIGKISGDLSAKLKKEILAILEEKDRELHEVVGKLLM